MRLEELKRGMLVDGVSPDGAVTLKNVESDGDGAVEVIFKNATGDIGERLLFRSDEANLKVVREDGGWRFDGDGARFRLAAEARRSGRLTSSIPGWRYTPRSWIPTRTRSPQS